MNNCLKFAALALLSSCICGCEKPQPEEDITVACYYFPNYHTGDPRNDARMGKDWTEWELVKSATPRFEGHSQPKVPAWGYTDEKDPKVMAQKIDAAADNGVDVFIFDWYHYEDGPFLNQCIDDGFLKAPNVGKIKFALMWANHDWVDIFPYSRGAEQELIYAGRVSPEAYDRICDHIVKDYFTKPNYWLIDGKAYFSIYDVQKFVENFGSIEATRAAMDRLQQKAKAAGLKGVHWNLVAWGNPILPVEKAPENTPELISSLNFDSATSYVWIHHCWPADAKTDYNAVRDTYLAHWDKARAEYGVPYYPNMTVGWDSSPRTDQSMGWDPSWGYPYSGTLYNNTPENFKTALRMFKEKILSDPSYPRVMNINCWNEWTEGSYLEPDTEHGTAYLDALREVFGD